MRTLTESELAELIGPGRAAAYTLAGRDHDDAFRLVLRARTRAEKVAAEAALEAVNRRNAPIRGQANADLMAALASRGRRLRLP